MEKMFNDLKSKYEKLYDELSRLKGEVIRYEFSKGGNVFFRGLYTPYLSFRYVWIGATAFRSLLQKRYISIMRMH